METFGPENPNPHWEASQDLLPRSVPAGQSGDFLSPDLAHAASQCGTLPPDSERAESPFLIAPAEWSQTWLDGSPVLDAAEHDFTSYGDPPLDSDDPSRTESLQLETTGVTRQEAQGGLMFGELWKKASTFKLSVAAKLREVGNQVDAASLEECHSRRIYARCNDCRSVQIFRNRCDQFFCPECQPKLAKKRAASVGWWASLLTQPKHVVLTVRNTPILTKRHVKQIKKWFLRLRKRKFCSNWKGGFYSVECTCENKGWHLHLHILVDARWVDARGLSAQWDAVTSGAGHIVKVKDCRDAHYLAEVTKYAAKGSDLARWDGHEINEFIQAFRGVRAFGVFGELYGKRSEFSEWIKSLKELRALCKCGSCSMRYFDENEWWAEENPTHKSQAARPPPPDAQQEFAAISSASRPSFPHWAQKL